MNDPHEQLEQELRTLWHQAANTRKATSTQRISPLLKRSRAELSMLCKVSPRIFKSGAFFQLFGAVVHAAVANPKDNNHESK